MCVPKQYVRIDVMSELICIFLYYVQMSKMNKKDNCWCYFIFLKSKTLLWVGNLGLVHDSTYNLKSP